MQSIDVHYELIIFTNGQLATKFGFFARLHTHRHGLGWFESHSFVKNLRYELKIVQVFLVIRHQVVQHAVFSAFGHVLFVLYQVMKCGQDRCCWRFDRSCEQIDDVIENALGLIVIHAIRKQLGKDICSASQFCFRACLLCLLNLVSDKLSECNAVAAMLSFKRAQVVSV